MSILISTTDTIGLETVEELTLTPEELEDLVSIPKNPDRLVAIGGVKGLAEKLNVDLEEGLPKQYNLSDSNQRIQRYGRNVLPDPETESLWSMILDALKDETLIILIVAAFISIILGALKWTSHNPKTGWIDGVAILVAVAIVTLVTSINNYKNQGRFMELNKKTSNKEVKLFRNGQQVLISIFEVMVGDILCIDTGDIVCADGVFIEGHSLVCDESTLTGESDPVKKGNGQGLDPFLLSGSTVQEGFGRMLVTAVGVNSLNGKIMMSLRTEQEDTPLQEKLTDLAEKIGKFGIGAAVLMLIIVIPKYFIEKKVNDEPITSSAASDITQIVVGAITIVVVAVPEGLPLAVTMALAYGMLKMFKENNLVRHLASCETMGSATTICSDKTGTLTQNVMTVVAGHICKPFDEVDYNLKYTLPAAVQGLLTDGICINSNAYESVNSKGRVEVIGSKTEGALLQFTKVLGADYLEVRKRLNVEKLYPFSSSRKRMGVLVGLDDDHYRLFSKGASERILESCDTYLDQEGAVQPLDAEAKEMFERAIFKFASDTLRTIGLAYRDYGRDSYDLDASDEPSTNLTLVGIVGIRDPLRPEVRGAVRQCQGAGIVVRMLTGDNIVTAENIARKCGILQPGDISMDSTSFNRMSEQELERVIPRLRVLARSSPLDKLRLVKKLKDMGEIVAVTGDGTNDGPALKMANVGFSMGVSGTEVAIAASDVVLLDDNFASIVRAVLWGRNIFDSICKFLQFQLTINIVAVTVAFVGTIYGSGKSPLTGVQLLWINLIMDTLAALALATEPPQPELLERPPTGKDAPLITRTMWRNIAGQATFQLAVQFVLLYLGPEIYNHFIDEVIVKDSVRHYTIIFNTFVFMQLFNEINARVLGNKLNPFKNIFANPIYLAILLITIVIQVLFVTFGGEVTSTVSLTPYEWLACVATGFFSLPLGFLLRCIPIKDKVYTPSYVSGKLETSPLLVSPTNYNYGSSV